MLKRRKKKSSQPYSEVIKLDNELKEYIKLCSGKSEKYTYYLDWKNEIKDKLLIFDSEDKVINIKHYLIQRKRPWVDTNNILLPIAVCYISVIIPLLTDMSKKGAFIFALVLLFVLIMNLIDQIYRNAYKLNFYSDLLDIVKEIETERGYSGK